MRFLLSLVAVAVGAIVVIKSEWLFEQFGRVDWAEEHLGSDGGSRLFYKLIGLAIILFALLYMSGVIEALLLALFAPVARGT